MLVKQNGTTLWQAHYACSFVLCINWSVKLTRRHFGRLTRKWRQFSVREKKTTWKNIWSAWWGESFLYFFSSSFYGPMKTLYYCRLSYFYASRKEFDRYCRSYISSFLITSSIIFYSYKGFLLFTTSSSSSPALSSADDWM